MTFTPPLVQRAIDLRPVRTGLRNALIANSSITALITDTTVSPSMIKVFRDFDDTRQAFPFLTISVVTCNPEDTYGTSGFRGIFDIFAWDKDVTATADTLGYLAQQAILDTPWSISGYAIVHKARAYTYSGSQEYKGIVFYRTGFSLDLAAYRTS